MNPKKCGECQWFATGNFQEDEAKPIGICSFFPGGSTRRFDMKACGIWPILYDLMEERMRCNGAQK